MAIVLKDFQKQAIHSLRHPGHLICISATGSGKSLIYEEYCKSNKPKALLITPLVALGIQQELRLLKAGVPASYGKPPRGSGVWISSPESRIPEMIRKSKWTPDFLIVDECHCVWEWGDDFRPDFLKIPQLIADFKVPRSLWLTATLPMNAHQDLVGRLPKPVRLQGRFEFPPLIQLQIYRVPWIYRMEFFAAKVRSLNEPGIVFVQTRSLAEKLAALLKSLGTESVFYHAGLSSEERRALEKEISKKIPKVIIATSAFGMGMDFAHLKWVLVFQAPGSLLGLAQAIGRVGRSGKAGEAILFWDTEDFDLLRWMSAKSPRAKVEVQAVHDFFTAARENPIQALSNYFKTLPECLAPQTS